MDRLEEIAKSLEDCQTEGGGFIEGYVGIEDVAYLLERVSELEAENERLEKERKLMLAHMARNGHLGPGGGW